MADTPIGTPMPRGVVDVEHDFVGVRENGINERRELVRLRRQVASLRARIESGRDATTGSGHYAIPMLITAFGLAGLVFTTVLRTRRRTVTPIGRTRAVLAHAWRHLQ